jgi:hypothetical protein
MGKEQNRNRRGLTPMLNVYTDKPAMVIGRPPKPEHLRRSKLFPLRFTPGEMQELEEASRNLGETVAAILRKGAALYIHQKGKGGSKPKGDKQR